MELTASQAYANFRAWVPRNMLSVGVRHPQPWLYYDWGPRSYPEPLICFHSLIGSPESFFHQVISLAPRGYRVLSIQIPPYWTIVEFCEAFHAFLDMLNLSRIHIYAAGLGGFLALQYAAQKPERISSIVLTHAFLDCDPINTTVPYSASVLRWLPDFLVRSTIRSLFPKGRTSLHQANAAEFSIGHTMTAPRELLASRLALFATSSTVVSRLHIPESRITLIDTLDRPASSLQTSERTASELKGARRAFLKEGGDFPFLSVPDDVIVHLVVHMRRHAASPTAPMPVPPPARPHPLPESILQRKKEEAMRSEATENNLSSPQTAGNSRRLHEEVLVEARAIVIADERATIERYAIEINRLRDYLPERDESYIGAVVTEANGNVELAISNASDGMYDDSFYENVHARAIENAIILLRQAEGDALPFNEGDENMLHAEGSQTDPEDHMSNAFDGIEHTHDMSDPLGSSEIAPNGQDGIEDVHQAIDADTDSAFDEAGMEAILLSPSVKSTEHDDGTDGYSDNFDGIADDDDNELGDEHRTNGSSSSSRKRRARRRAPTDGSTDGKDAYVSSDRVGMRSSGTMVGRGPAPFKSPTEHSSAGAEESWVRPLAPSEEDQEGEPLGDDVGSAGLKSGASLLEASENPLDLSAGGRPNGSKDQRWGAEKERVEKNGDTLFAWDGLKPQQDSGFTALEPEDISTSGPTGEEVLGGDEWEQFRTSLESDAGSAVLARPAVKAEKPDSEETETEEQRRLRMWSMSAVAAASKSVHR